MKKCFKAFKKNIKIKLQVKAFLKEEIESLNSQFKQMQVTIDRLQNELKNQKRGNSYEIEMKSRALTLSNVIQNVLDKDGVKCMRSLMLKFKQIKQKERGLKKVISHTQMKQRLIYFTKWKTIA